jgi:hypothetical protein
MLGQKVIMFNTLRTHLVVSPVAQQFTFLPQCMKVPISLLFITFTIFSFVLIIVAILVTVK